MFFILKKLQKSFFTLGLLIIFGVLFWGASSVYSEDFTSTNYKSRDPIMGSGGFSTSTSFQLYSAISQPAISTSTSANFGINAGFLYYPVVLSTPVISATAGDSQVVLTWSAGSAALGWVPSSYSVGKSTASGGSYEFSSVGNVLSSTQTGLTNSTAYYFVVRMIDGVGDTLAT